MYSIPRHPRFVAAMAMVCLGVLLAANVLAQAPQPERREAVRDSLRAEIKRYAEAIASLKESVAEIDTVGEARADRVAETAESVAALSAAVGQIAEQVSELEIEYEDGRVSILDGRGGRVSVDIPEDFGEQLSRSLESITAVILDEIPDTLNFGDHSTGITFDGFGRGVNVVPVAPPPPPSRRVIQGGVVKFKDDLEIADDEVVLGDAVVIMGDVLIDGRVEGDLVVVLGDLTLTETAEVDGQIITVLGRLDRADGASVGSLTVVNPGEALLPTFISGDSGDWIGFWGWQALFILLVFLVLLMIALTPRARLDQLIQTLASRPAECLGIGLLMALVGHLVLLGLGAILVLTVIGIPVALLVLLAMALLDLAAVGIASLVVGRRICGVTGRDCGNIWREVLLGMVILHVPALVAALLGVVGAPMVLVLLLSWLGRGVKFIAFCFGLGSLVLGRFGNRRPVMPVAPPLDPAPETSGA